MKQDQAKKELLCKLGQALYEGLREEKVGLDSKGKSDDFKTELERVTALIDYVKNKQNNLSPRGHLIKTPRPLNNLKQSVKAKAKAGRKVI